jgi:hypothetical protein
MTLSLEQSIAHPRDSREQFIAQERNKAGEQVCAFIDKYSRHSFQVNIGGEMVPLLPAIGTYGSDLFSDFVGMFHYNVVRFFTSNSIVDIDFDELEKNNPGLDMSEYRSQL